MLACLLPALLPSHLQEVQPLLPSREQEELSGLSKPLTRWRDAEPLLEEDARCQRLPYDERWVGSGGIRVGWG